MQHKIVRTRMAPSPTGELHVGSMAMVLKNYAYTRKHNGKFVLRIEDTDLTREVAGAVQRIQDIIHAYGLDWDEGPQKGGPHAPYIQSERLSIYKEKAEELVALGKAYYCFATPEELSQMREKLQREGKPPRYNGMYRDYPLDDAQKRIAAGEPYVIRLRVPENTPLAFNDLIHGTIEINSDQVDDQVLLKSDGFPTYHLAVVVDDHLMEITHIFRGEEWISSTPKHILLYQAFDWNIPTFAHFPVFLNPDGKGKMSKRKGTVSSQSFLDRGFLPEALLNFFMILGWSSSDQREILSLNEYIQEFEPSDMSPNPVAFDIHKLTWLNGQYIRSLSLEELTKRLQPFVPQDLPKELLPTLVPLIADRLETLADFEELTSFFYRDISPEKAVLLKKATPDFVSEQLQQTIRALETCDWDESSLETTIRSLQDQTTWQKRQYFMMIRVAISGQVATPPLFSMMAALGKELTLKRLYEAYLLVNTN